MLAFQHKSQFKEVIDLRHINKLCDDAHTKSESGETSLIRTVFQKGEHNYKANTIH